MCRSRATKCNHIKQIFQPIFIFKLISLLSTKYLWKYDFVSFPVYIKIYNFIFFWPFLNLFLNQWFCFAILQKHTGVLAILDEESRFPKATDMSLAAKLHHGPGMMTIDA